MRNYLYWTTSLAMLCLASACVAENDDLTSNTAWSAADDPEVIAVEEVAAGKPDLANNPLLLGDEQKGDDGEEILECGMNTFIGKGSCTKSCYRDGSCDASQGYKPRYRCQVFNYEHWKNCYPAGSSTCTSENRYWRAEGPFNYTFCANSDPSNCPGFCN